MKNKKLLYVLIPAVLFIWGYIIIMVLNAFYGNDKTNNVAPVAMLEEVEKNTIDTFSIYPDYRDPFLGEFITKAKTSNANAANAVVKKPVTASIVWPTISYGGLIKNQTSNKQLAIVNINGSSNIMKVGEKAGEIELLKIFSDSIEIRMGKEKRFVRK